MFFCFSIDYGLLYEPKTFFRQTFSNSLNYECLSWASTNRTTLKMLLSQQKHASRNVNDKTRLEYTKDWFPPRRYTTLPIFVTGEIFDIHRLGSSSNHVRFLLCRK